MPRPLPPPPPAEPVDVAPTAPPAAPPAAPRGTIQTRTHYAEADVTEWVLTNGATVVFKPIPNGGMVDLLGVSGRSVACSPRYSAQSPAGDLSSLFREALDASAVYVVVGDARQAEVEVSAARLLRMRPEDAPCVDPAGLAFSYALPLVEDDATLSVLVEVLRARGLSTFARNAPGRTVLAGAPEAAALVALRPTAGEISAARAAVSQRIDTAPYWLNALADLYLTDVDLRPSLDPSFVSRFPARIARVSARTVTDLAARFAASPIP